MDVETAAVSERGDASGLSAVAVVWLLGISQIIGYGTLYYSFAILAEDAATNLGWPVSWFFASLSLGLLISGILAPQVGRRIDRHGAGLVMTIGSAFSTLALLTAAWSPTALAFAVPSVAIQITSTLVLYDAAFAALVQVGGPSARLHITQLTLIAGFASTIFWPLTAWLHDIMGWREVYLLFAAVNAVFCVPAHWLLARHHHLRSDEVRTMAGQAVDNDVLSSSQKRTLWLATAGFALAGFSLSAMLAQMVPVLTATGIGASALMVSTLYGPAQVLIRLVNLLAGVGRHPIIATLIAIAMLPLAIGILTTTSPSIIGSIVFVVFLGFGSGLKSIVQGTLPLALFGSSSYGTRLGFMASVRQALAAVAPFAVALLIEQLGITWTLVFLIVVATAGLVCMLIVGMPLLRRTIYPK